MNFYAFYGSKTIKKTLLFINLTGIIFKNASKILQIQLIQNNQLNQPSVSPPREGSGEASTIQII
jgi:hypothetical protein